jgi:hypothetical protein
MAVGIKQDLDRHAEEPGRLRVGHVRVLPGGSGYRGLKYNSTDGLALRDLGQDIIDLRHRSALDRNRLKILYRHEAEQFTQFGQCADIRALQGDVPHGEAEGQMTPNISAIGVPIMDDRERPIAALSVTAISDRVRGQRALWLASLLRQEAAYLASLIQKSRD